MMASLALRRTTSLSVVGSRFYASAKEASGSGLLSWPTEATAIVYESHGAPETVLKLAQLPLPALKALDDHQVAVRVLASPINPADINQIQGTYPVKPALPAIGGNEGVGVVVAAGKSVRSVSIGEWVIPKSSGHGTWRTHYVAGGEDVQRIPKSLSLSAAATLSVNPCTAYRMIKDFVHVSPGETLIQNGANSAVGQLVIQLAAAFGINTVNVIRERPDFAQVEQELKGLGATAVISDKTLGSYQMQTFWEERKLTRPKLGLNMVGGANATNLVRQLDNNGVMVTYGGMSREPVSVPTGSFIFQNITLKGFWMTQWNKESTPESRAAMLEELAELIRVGKLKTHTEARPIAEFKEAIAAARQPMRVTTPKQLLIMK